MSTCRKLLLSSNSDAKVRRSSTIPLPPVARLSIAPDHLSYVQKVISLRPVVTPCQHATHLQTFACTRWLDRKIDRIMTIRPPLSQATVS